MNPFARLELMVGAEGMARLRAARVTVVGLGAVGSYTTEALARAGIGRLCLIDGDVIQPSNLNRQLYALHSTVGRPKTELAAERVRDINPACQVDARHLFVDRDSLPDVLALPPDVLIDAIDSLGPKVHLLAGAHAAGVPLILSSMGAARRTDFRRVEIADIADTHDCPLARLVRKRLHRHGIRSGIRVVYSHEPVPELPLDTGGDDVSAGQRGRPRVPLPSLPTLTGIFGLLLAQEAITHIAGTGANPAPPVS